MLILNAHVSYMYVTTSHYVMHEVQRTAKEGIRTLFLTELCDSKSKY